MGTLETHGLRTGNREIDHHKKKVEPAVMLWQDADYNHPLSWQKK